MPEGERPPTAPAAVPAAVPADAPIGVFDSGVGGLTVLRALQQRLPRETLLYLGDTARVPYGAKSADTVRRYATQIASFLMARQIKYLVVACNTASAHALEHLRAQLPIPVMGVVEPGAEIAVQRVRQGTIGVIGTLGTVASCAYQRAIHARRPDLAVFSQACPLLVPLTEEGWIDHPVTRQVVSHYLLELRAQSGDLDTLVLGCTHYPLLGALLAVEAARVFGHPVDLVDSAEAVAVQVAVDLDRRGIASESARAPDHRFFFTDVSRFSELASLFLGRQLPRVELADL